MAWDTTKVANDDILSAEWNEMVKTHVPIGSIISWAKNFKQVYSGVNSSVTINKLVDSTASFSGINNYIAWLVGIQNLTVWAEAGLPANPWQSRTLLLNPDSSKGFIIDSHNNQTRCTNASYGARSYVVFYYTDGTTFTTETQTNTSTSYTDRSYKNPFISKPVWKIIVYLTTSSNGSAVYCKNDIVYYLNPDTATITNIDSATQLSLSSDIFKTTNSLYKIFLIPTLPSQWVECNGQVLSDAESIYNGLTIPDLKTKFILGASVSGIYGGYDSHSHIATGADNGSGAQPASTTQSGNIPPFYSVVWIMRVK